LNDRLKKYTKKTDRGKSKEHARDKIKAIFESEESASAGSNSDSEFEPEASVCADDEEGKDIVNEIVIIFFPP
jgi:hypothetical protein